MKQLLISTAIIISILIIWTLFITYSFSTLDILCSQIGEEVLPLLEEEKWDEAASTLTKLTDQWSSYKNKAFFFLDNATIYQIDETFYRKQVDKAIATISKFGDFEAFVSDGKYVDMSFMNIPEDAGDEIPFK